MDGPSRPTSPGDRPPMTLQRLGELLEAYGARSEGWPVEEQSAALALLRESAEGRRLRNQAAALDTVLDRSRAPAPSAALLDRVLAAAPAAVRETQGIRGSHATIGTSRPPAYDGAHASRRPARSRWRAVAVASFVAAASLALWLTRQPDVPPVAVTTQAAGPEIDDYSAPSDALLDAETVAVLDTLPVLGCETAGDWGCPELDFPEDQSKIDTARRAHA